MKIIFPSRIAEIIYGLVMAAFGVMHIKLSHDAGAMKGVPDYIPGGGTIWLYITGAAFIAAAVAIIINQYKRLACYLLALMLFVFILAVHLKPFLADHYNVYQPLKDIGLAMAAILIGNSAKK